MSARTQALMVQTPIKAQQVALTELSEEVRATRPGFAWTLDLERARLVTESYRFEGHYAGEPEVYRERSEVAEWRKKDPIPRFHDYLVENGKASQSELDAIDAEIKQEMADAVKFALESPPPDPATALDYIYA